LRGRGESSQKVIEIGVEIQDIELEFDDPGKVEVG